MNNHRIVFLLLIVFILAGCRTIPVYRGDGVHCTGGSWAEISSTGSGPRSSIDNDMLKEIDSWMGTPYLYGGNSRSGVDCSGFTQSVYEAVDIQIPRTASQQAAAAESINPSNLKFGDLLFFNTSGSGISHVGIFIGNGFFVHASSSRGVVRESLSKEYYANRIVSAGRYLK
ncbi:MAG: C40 family peptidase [Candidatus Aegiribacteria sp.]|nr:C40 family peptidase [Candidatus Aegiribacteria sp.]